MALSSFETRVTEAILRHPIIYEKSARNVRDVDDKVELAFESVQKELKEKHDYNFPSKSFICFVIVIKKCRYHNY